MNRLTFHTINHDASWRRQQKFLEVFVSLPLDDVAALIALRIRAQLANLATPIGFNDLLIAAIALSHDLTLVKAG